MAADRPRCSSLKANGDPCTYAAREGGKCGHHQPDAVPPCDRAPKCQTLKKDGTPCPQPAMRHVDFCWYHRRSHASALKAAKPIRDHQEANAAVARFGLPVTIDPHAVLMQEIHYLAGHAAYLRALIDDGESDPALFQDVYTDGGSYKDVSAEVKLYLQIQDRLVKVSKAAIDAGIEERKVRIAEQTGELIAEVLRRSLAELGVNDRPEVSRIVGRHLREIAAKSSA